MMKANQVRWLRRRLGLTVPEFANAVGVGRGAVYRWENGTRTPLGSALVLLRALSGKAVVKRRKKVKK